MWSDGFSATTNDASERSSQLIPVPAIASQDYAIRALFTGRTFSACRSHLPTFVRGAPHATTGKAPLPYIISRASAVCLHDVANSPGLLNEDETSPAILAESLRFSSPLKDD
jgi:hypothetical protein